MKKISIIIMMLITFFFIDVTVSASHKDIIDDYNGFVLDFPTEDTVNIICLEDFATYAETTVITVPINNISLYPLFDVPYGTKEILEEYIILDIYMIDFYEGEYFVGARLANIDNIVLEGLDKLNTGVLYRLVYFDDDYYYFQSLNKIYKIEIGSVSILNELNAGIEFVTITKINNVYKYDGDSGMSFMTSEEYRYQLGMSIGQGDASVIYQEGYNAAFQDLQNELIIRYSNGYADGIESIEYQIQIIIDEYNQILEQERLDSENEIQTIIDEYNQMLEQEKLESYNAGKNAGLSEGTSNWGVIWSAFLSVFDILAVELLPGLTIGMIVAVPLVLGILSFIIGVATAKKGGKK